MKKTCVVVKVVLKEPIRGIYKYRYTGYKKAKYKMKGDNAKIYLTTFAKTTETIEFSNVLYVKIGKYKK